MTPNYDLDEAYSIDGPEDARKLYDDWAATYDASFADGWGYVAPREIARIMLAEGDPTPILDIGAGTGRVAENLEGRVVDGLDISPEMLAEADNKGLYRNLITGDLTQPLDIADGTYGGVISSGTFTHGHVGPGCFSELLRITRPGALFCCGVIATVLDGMGFGSTLAMLVAERRISPVRFKVIDIYEGADHPHAKDRGLVMVFERL